MNAHLTNAMLFHVQTIHVPNGVYLPTQAVELGSGICVIEEIGNSTGTNPYKTTGTDATDVNAINTDMAVEWPSCGRDGAVVGPWLLNVKHCR